MTLETAYRLVVSSAMPGRDQGTHTQWLTDCTVCKGSLLGNEIRNTGGPGIAVRRHRISKGHVISSHVESRIRLINVAPAGWLAALFPFAIAAPHP